MSKESELQTGPHSEGRPRVLEGLLGKFSRRSKSQTSSAPSNNAQPKQKYGMFAFQPDSPECCIDIVAVHGLGGHFENTWTWNPADSPGEKPCNWLKDLLPSEFPNARILSFGYNSAVALSKSIADISMFGEMLLTRTLMERMKPWQRNRPIIFVGHSLGGIVIKKALMEAKVKQDSQPECSDLLNSLRGILFMGTPHQGSGTASLGAIVADMLKAASLGTSTNSALIKELKANSKTLQEISKDFTFTCGGIAGIKIYSFVESEAMDYFPGEIVTEQSARLNWPNERVFHLNGNHSNMCKFSDKDDNDYSTVLTVLGQLVNASKNIISEYLGALGALAMDPPELSPERTTRERNNWFFESPEFNQWTHNASEILWLTGKPGDGKTVLAYCLRDHLSQGCTFNDPTDIAFSTCKSWSDNAAETALSSVARVLCTLVVQLLRINPERNKLVTRQYQQLLERPSSPRASLVSEAQLSASWKVLSACITLLPSQQTILIIDGVDGIEDEGTRRSFLRNLLSMHREVLARGVIDCKFFVTSRPYHDITEELRKFPNIERDKERQECLRSLKFDELSARRDRVEEAVAGTGEWLADDQNYQSWDGSEQSSLLLIRGKPGSGKSTLAKSILEEKKMDSNIGRFDDPEAFTVPKVLIADFFYSFRGGKKERSHTLMLQSLLFQLLSQDASLFPLFQSIYRAQRAMANSSWKHEDLKSIFASLSSLQASAHRSRIYILLDAMDESSEGERPEILTLLQGLCSSDSTCTFKCLVASRPLPAGQINHQAWREIILEEKNQKDIQRLIQSSLNEVKTKPGLNKIDFQFAEHYMAKHAQGVFLWVSLVMNELLELASTGPSQKEVDDSLQKLPPELDDFYALIIGRLVRKADQDASAKKANRSKLDMIEKGAKMLNWVTFAERPLTEEEFQDAIAIPSSPNQFSPDPRFLTNNRVTDLNARINACCGPLLEIKASVVQLLHLSAREYLLRDGKPAKPFDTDEERGDAEISSCCIRYLSLLTSQPQSRALGRWAEQDYDELVRGLAEFPLLNYILQYLPRHLQTLAGTSIFATDLSVFLSSLHKSAVFLSLLGDWTKKAFSRSEYTDPKPTLNCSQFKLRCLLAAAKKGLTAVVKSMIHLDADLNGVENETGMTALMVSSLHGHFDVVETLLEHSADVNAHGSHYGNALQIASFHGDLRLVQILLNTGAEVNAQGGHFGNALQAASFHGHLEVVKLLATAGADLNAQGGHFGNALQAASFHGHLEIVKLLLTDRTIQIASSHGSLGVVGTRLRTDANVNAQGGHFGNALQAASFHGDLRVADWLLQNGADVNAKGGPYGNALRAASINGHSEVMQLLLDRGADIDT